MSYWFICTFYLRLEWDMNLLFAWVLLHTFYNVCSFVFWITTLGHFVELDRQQWLCCCLCPWTGRWFSQWEILGNCYPWETVWLCSLLDKEFLMTMRLDMPCGWTYLWDQAYMNRGMHFCSSSKFHYLCSSHIPMYWSTLLILWLSNLERPANYLYSPSCVKVSTDSDSNLCSICSREARFSVMTKLGLGSRKTWCFLSNTGKNQQTTDLSSFPCSLHLFERKVHR